MPEILENSNEEMELFRIVKKIREKFKIHKEVAYTIIVLIDTTQKLQKLKDWIASKTENGVFNTTEAEITNMVSRIAKM